MNQSARLNTAVTFARGTRFEFTLAAGSIVEAVPSFFTATNDSVYVTFAGRTELISIDDASPVEWDDFDKMWVEA